MWEKYGIYIILLVVLAIVGAVSFESFKSWRQAKSETWSDTYAYALNLENQGKYDESLKVLEQMEKPAATFTATLPDCRRQTFCLNRAKTKKPSKFWKRLPQTKA